jgi:hypothetical protein
MGLRAAVPFALVGNTEKQNNFFKRMMLTELEEVKHAMFAHDGGMGGNGTWLSPFAFSWRLRAAVPFALSGAITSLLQRDGQGGVEGIALQVQT